MANEAIEQCIEHCALLHGDHAIIERARAELATVKSVFDTLEKDAPPTPAEWHKVCDERDKLRTDLEEKTKQFNDIKFRYERMVGQLENLIPDERKKLWLNIKTK